jgi:glycosyltransferase involved in cell wall biosynthesis
VHVLYLHQYFVPPGGWGGSRSYEMARRLVRSGHRVTVVTSSADFPASYRLNEPVSSLELEGMELRVIRVPYSNRMGFLGRLSSFVSFAARALLECGRVDKPDVVFATSTPLTIAVPGIFAKLRHRIPMVFEVRDLWPELPVAVGALRNPVLIWLARRLERAAYRHSRGVVALSPGMKDGVVGTGYPADRVVVVPNSCDVELFRGARGDAFLDKHPQLKGGPVVAYAGTLGRINGVGWLVDVAAESAKLGSDLRFAVVGDGAERESVEAKARAAGVLGKNLWMLPPVAKNEMPEVLAAASVAASLFIDLPEMWHNSANKFFDALAAGKPVMINYQGWQADVLRETGAGIVAPVGDPAGAARALRDFLADEAGLRRAAAAAAALADGRFNRDRLFDRLHETLKAAVAG